MEASKNASEDQSDNRSSSLSELGDGLDEHDEPTPQAHTSLLLEENDSEAETERLENTPRKLLRTTTNTTMASDNLVEKTPSKLGNVFLLDTEESSPPTPLGIALDPTTGDIADRDTDMNSVSQQLSVVAGSDEGSLADIAGRKRKRSSSDSSSADDLRSEEPARKRSSTAKSDAIMDNHVEMVDVSEQADLDQGADIVEGPITRSAEQELDIEETVADAAEEAVDELAAAAKLSKPRKGKRKGKKADDSGDNNSEPIANNEGFEGAEPAEVEHDEEDGPALDEEVTKKKAAIESLSKIEKKFKIFREKWCDESLAQLSKELEMLRQPDCEHPEYLAMVQCVDERRSEKVEYERRLFHYKQKCLNTRTVAERHQLHSQYFQTVREIRERFISECNQRIYNLQRGRRQLGMDETEYAYSFPEKRSQQVQYQTAYNLEVSILSGVAKYVGFPAAPDISSARPSDIDDDLRAMKIPTRPAPPAYVRQYNRPTREDEAAAEEQFIEQTPWANPQHPAHHQSHYQGIAVAPPRTVSQNYHTPVAQRRMVDVGAPNGSASTIDMLSNTPSSAVAPGQAAQDQAHQINEADSPVLPMKRHPIYSEGNVAADERRTLIDIPGSQSQNISSLARESYSSTHHLFSPPAATHTDNGKDEHETSRGVSVGSRWSGSGMRHLTAAASPPARTQEQSVPTSVPSRNDPSKTPLSQRGGLGAVSVGSGDLLFGR
ncbi:hypothetical protein K432DRAFT_303785 [Lepidopterella palustris CBS 459.81]|uniref:Transcriptional regulatory protein DEP1 n=1 Tax=Lepidopterella palustris CBS 459.81 TaxID=1314670 RepID=A0A8E2E572_9PEZI|nr:hypothetical protein K432DRAFT_303785 [Lepidopterella palustris CBS 459.81]